jgi:hypothetical protein
MPSASLARWHAERLPRVRAVDAEVTASLARTPPDPDLTDELLRAAVVALSAHFQGFCRDLYLEAAQVVVSKVRLSLQNVFQDQFRAHRQLDRGNPTLAHIAGDFDRLGFSVREALDADPANALRVNHLALLNKWRNAAAHAADPPAGAGPLTPAAVRAWTGSLDGLAVALDTAMYNQLRLLLRRKPW